VLCYFVGSGLAALIYEIVWFQLLEFVVGSTPSTKYILNLMEARRIPPGLFVASAEALAKLNIHPVVARQPRQYR